MCVGLGGVGGEAGVDWTFAHLELLQKQGVDLRTEMETRSVAVYTDSAAVAGCLSKPSFVLARDVTGLSSSSSSSSKIL